MSKAILVVSVLCSVFILSACTTRELATGAAAGAAGYVIGSEVEEDKHD